MKKLLLPVIILAQFLNLQAVYAENNAFANLAPVSIDESTTDKLLDLLQKTIASSNLSSNFKFFDSELSHGIYIDGRYRAGSKPSVNGQYSRVDAFSVGGSLLVEQLLNIELPINPGATIARELVYIRQFKSRNDSLFTLPLALSKMPSSSQKALALEEGTLVSYRAPMGILLGEDASNELSKLSSNNIKVKTGISFFAVGEFDIHIFRMKDNQVRVKLFALNQKGGGIDVKLSLFDLIPGVNGVVAKLLDFNILKLGWRKTNTNLFLADYVFNLNNSESRSAYDNIMGQNYNLAHFPFINSASTLSYENLKNRLYVDLKNIDKIVKQDVEQDLNSRRIVRIIKGENKTKTFGSRFNLNVKFLKVVSNSSWSNGTLQTFDLDDNVAATYKLKGFTKQSEFAYNLFWLKGGQEKINYSSNLILNSNEKFESLGLVGFNWIHRYENSSFNDKNFIKIKKQLNQLYPNKTREIVKIPEWNINGRNKVFIESEVFINKNAIKFLETVSKEKIIATFNEILADAHGLQSMPFGTENPSLAGISETERLEAYHRKDYVSAYSWDVHYMASFLSKIADSSLTVADREAVYESLSNDTPVFHEIGPTLFTKLIPEEKLSDFLVMHLRMSGENLQSVDQCYPNIKVCGDTNLFREVSAENTLITEKSFNLRHYMNEKAEIYSLAEIMIK